MTSSGTSNHDDVDRGGEIAERGDAKAGGLQRGVQLPVLHQFDGFGEGQIFDLAQIGIGDAGTLQDGARIQLGSRFRSADGEAFALEVGQRLDPGLLRSDDLHVIGIDRADAAQLVQLGLEADFLIALPGVGQAVAEREGDFALALLQQVQILDRSLGRLHGWPAIGNLVGEDFRDGDAQRIVDARMFRRSGC